jgi:hypothetical protein
VNARYSAVAARAGHRCEYCHAPEAVFNLPFEVEHIIPRTRGGSDGDDNLALACRSCNVFKSDCVERQVTTGLSVPLFHPRSDTWSAHFDVAESGEVTGKSHVGQATVEQLRMNSAAQVAARLHWIQLGLYP